MMIMMMNGQDGAGGPAADDAAHRAPRPAAGRAPPPPAGGPGDVRQAGHEGTRLHNTITVAILNIATEYFP